MDNKIYFVDVTSSLNGYYFGTNGLGKPTWTGKYLNYLSKVPEKFKISVINGLFERNIFLVHTKFHNDNMQLIKTTLLNNNNTMTVINITINKRINHILSSKVHI